MTDDAGCRHVPQTNINIELFARSDGCIAEHFTPNGLGNSLKVELCFLGCLGEHFTPQSFRFFRIARAQILADFCTGFTAAHKADPLRIRFSVRRCDDLDHVAVLQRRGQWLLLPINAAADGLVADIGVNLIGKINRARALRQAHDLASRSEDIDAIREEVNLDVFKELTAVSTGALNFHQTL